MAAALVQVRGHHLLCLLTYVGRGYTAAFVQAMDALARRVADGEPIQLCVGPDVLCASLQQQNVSCQAHCHLARNAQRDRAALRAIAALLERPMQNSLAVCLTPVDIDIMRRRLSRLDADRSVEGLRAACRQCEWLGLCRKVTATRFMHTRLLAPDAAG